MYQHLSSANPDDQQALMTVHRAGDYATKLALHETHYAATSAALLTHVDGFLEEIDRVIRKSDAHPSTSRTSTGGCRSSTGTIGS